MANADSSTPMTVTVDTKEVEKGLGDLKNKTPITVKRAINTTAKKMRKSEVKQAKKRYALTPRGRKKLDGLKERQKATVKNLANISRQSDEGHALDASYFLHRPTEVHSGRDVFANSPKNYAVKVLKNKGYKKLVAEGSPNRSKAFLASIHNKKAGNDHIAMLQRRLDGRPAKSAETNRGKKRWKDSKSGIVQATYTKVFVGASSMERKVWDDTVRAETEADLEANLKKSIAQTIENAKRKAK